MNAYFQSRPKPEFRAIVVELTEEELKQLQEVGFIQKTDSGCDGMTVEIEIK